MRVMYLVGTLCFSKAHHMTFLGTLSYAFSRSITTMCKSFFCSLYLSINCRIRKIASMVDLPGMNPNWFWVTLVTLLMRCSIRQEKKTNKHTKYSSIFIRRNLT
ncbi:hypothetical protein PVAP13_3NG177112 [Panicum virgatum]|uniref:Uncharacterized protein n=1 Tax=Panicum virgatum TaxID=38727 RepID=A0A8T0U903_PANVG|nr:hypothetical protein PVAP13_3NG177112 [Panicum virgatum]